MHDIEMHFMFGYITDYPNYYLGNELVRVGNCIHVSPKKYLNEILRKYHNTHGDLKKELLIMKVKEHPDLKYSPYFNGKDLKYFQHNILLCKYLIVVGRFYLEYYFSLLSKFSDASQVGHLYLAINIFGYLKNYPRQGYKINPQPLTVDFDYDKFQMKYDFVNHYV